LIINIWQFDKFHTLADRPPYSLLDQNALLILDENRRQKKISDIDTGIYFIQPPEGMDLLYLINTLSELAGREVDVVVLNNAPPFLRHQIMKNRVILTIKDMAAYTRFREKTISDYDEYKYISGMNVYDR